MKFKYFFAAMLIGLVLTACNRTNVRSIPPVSISAVTQNEKSQIAEAVLARLKDPDSAKFGEAILIDDGKGACIEVNSKNSYGGYTGNQYAMLMNVPGTNGWYTAGIKDITVEHCVRAVHSVLNDKGFL